MYIETDAGTMLGLDMEMVRLLDDEDSKSGRHVKQRFHVLLSNVVFIDYRDGCSVWVEQDAMGMGLGCNQHLADSKSFWWKLRFGLFPGNIIRNGMNLGFIMVDTWKVDLEQAVGKRPIFDLVEKFKLEPDGNRADRD